MIIIPNDNSSLDFDASTRIDKYNLNNRLAQLYDNDKAIVSSIEASLVTERVYSSEFNGYTNSTIFTSNVIANYLVVIAGSTTKVDVNDLKIKGSILTLNDSDSASAVQFSGFRLLTSTIAGSETQSVVYNLDNYYWLFSGNGIEFGSTLIVSNLMATQRVVEVVGLTEYGPTVIKDDTDSSIWARKGENNVVNLFSKSPTKSVKKLRTQKEEFTNIMYDQKGVNALYGSNLSGTGFTLGGFPYETVSGSVVVTQNSNYAVLFDFGSYVLNYNIKLSGGKIKGKNREFTKIKGMKAIDIDNCTGAEITDLNFSNCTGDHIISIVNSRKCKVDIKAENNPATYVIKSSNSLGNTFDCVMINNNICFKDSDRDFYKGVYESNVATFESCVGMAQIFEDNNLVFGGI